MNPANRSAIKVRELTKTYGDKVVVDDVSFSVEEGEILAIVGPNGAGKGTVALSHRAVRESDSTNEEASPVSAADVQLVGVLRVSVSP